MSTYKLTIAYDGTDLVGWQRQADGTSVQGLLEAALSELDGRQVVVIGAGRTDAGVHALGQVAGFSIDRVIDAASITRALNAKLPPAVRVIDATETRADFHARFDARAKTYRYRIWNDEVLSPFERAYAWHVPAPRLDVEAMAAAAALFEGRHDFAAFQASGAATRTTERTVFSCRVRAEPPAIIACEVSGDGFLRHMVRNMIGTLVEVGRGRRPVDWVGRVLTSRDRAQAGPTAPADGLFLMSVSYGVVQ